MIDNRQVNNQADLAKLKGISRARVTQILNLLKLDSSIIQELEKLGEQLNSKIVTERMLRSSINKSSENQLKLLEFIETLFFYKK